MSESVSTLDDACDWSPKRRGLAITAVPATFAPTPWRGETTPTLSDLTTLGVGGPIKTYVEVDTERDFIDAISSADAEGKPVLVLGGGSNLVAPDEGFDGVVVRDLRREIDVVDDSACGGATVRVSAGMPLDELVVRAIEEGWMGLESLSGIPGSVGAAPVQNVGAYGHEVSEVISSVATWDRLTGQRHHMPLSELAFGYRTSVLKRTGVRGGPPMEVTGRWVVTSVEFAFRHATLSAPVAYRQLAEHMGVVVGERVDSVRVREAVLDLRRGKGMVLDPADPDTHSAGSFFTNPVLTTAGAEGLPPEAPRYPVYDYTARRNIADEAPIVDDRVKTSAAWLIAHAGIDRGERIEPNAPVAISSKHTLALARVGHARAVDVRLLADHVVEAVRERFGITLTPEPAFFDAKGRLAWDRLHTGSEK